MPAVAVVVLGAAVASAILGVNSFRKRSRRREETSSVAQDLLPEIRAVMTTCDPGGPSGGLPSEGERYVLVRQRLPRILPKEALFSVETFYQCVDAYARASQEMTAAFAAGSKLSLGDQVRAKDRRDRCLKDVYYAGEGALERLHLIADG